MVRLCDASEFEEIWEIVNDGAAAYRGVVPADRLLDPYMSREELRHEIEDGVVFWGMEREGRLVGVMGLQKVLDVTLIRHAYVRSVERRGGVGGVLLDHLVRLTDRTILVGTWADAGWAIRFYEKHGFAVVAEEEKRGLLQKYWRVPERQIETSVVLRY